MKKVITLLILLLMHIQSNGQNGEELEIVKADGDVEWRWDFDINIDSLSINNIEGHLLMSQIIPKENAGGGTDRTYLIMRIEFINNDLAIAVFETATDIGEIITNTSKYDMGKPFGYLRYKKWPILVVGKNADMFFKKSKYIKMSPLYEPYIYPSSLMSNNAGYYHTTYIMKNHILHEINSEELDYDDIMSETDHLDYIEKDIRENGQDL